MPSEVIIVPLNVGTDFIIKNIGNNTLTGNAKTKSRKPSNPVPIKDNASYVAGGIGKSDRMFGKLTK